MASSAATTARVRDHGRLLPPPHGADARRHDARAVPRARAAARRARRARRGRADRAAPGPLPRRRSIRAGYDRPMRFPVVLFDLDGTVVDSGAIILASMRHATQTVLGRELHRRRAAGRTSAGRGSRRRWRRSRPDQRRRARARLPRAQRAAARHARGLRRDGATCSSALRDEGRRLGIVTAKRRATVELAFAHVPLGAPLRGRRRRRRDRAAQARPGAAAARARAARRRRRATRPTSATRRSTCRRRRPAACYRRRRHLGRHPRPRGARATPTSSSTRAEELLDVL